MLKFLKNVFHHLLYLNGCESEDETYYVSREGRAKTMKAGCQKMHQPPHE